MLPQRWKAQVSYSPPGRPGGAGSDDASFSCHSLPAFNLGALGWDYGSYTWHTNLDTYDKVVFDDLKSNAALAAMLAYLASEDPGFVTREPVAADSVATRGGRRQGTWHECERAGRSTVPRLR
jgi:hypothetical protein